MKPYKIEIYLEGRDDPLTLNYTDREQAESAWRCYSRNNAGFASMSLTKQGWVMLEYKKGDCVVQDPELLMEGVN